MNEKQICVCGHPEINHPRDADCNGACFLCDTPSSDICEVFRPILDWPDSEGWWWMLADARSSAIVVKVAISRGEHVMFWGHVELTEQQWACANPPARFTKLLEQNPFPEPPRI